VLACLRSNTSAVNDSRVTFPFYVLKNLTHANTDNRTYSKGYVETDIMATFSKKGEEEEQQQCKNGYWRNELYSLGVLEPKRKKKEEVEDNKAELENLADLIKQSMFKDYRLAYSEEGDTHKEEAEPTVTAG
jgi:hypothetical protein